MFVVVVSAGTVKRRNKNDCEQIKIDKIEATALNTYHDTIPFSCHSYHLFFLTNTLLPPSTFTFDGNRFDHSLFVYVCVCMCRRIHLKCCFIFIFTSSRKKQLRHDTYQQRKKPNTSTHIYIYICEMATAAVTTTSIGGKAQRE